MTEPNEQIDEELSTDELKNVSGGIMICLPACNPGFSKSPQGSGSGETLKDWKKRNQNKFIDGDIDDIG